LGRRREIFTGVGSIGSGVRGIGIVRGFILACSGSIFIGAGRAVEGGGGFGRHWRSTGQRGRRAGGRGGRTFFGAGQSGSIRGARERTRGVSGRSGGTPRHFRGNSAALEEYPGTGEDAREAGEGIRGGVQGYSSLNLTLPAADEDARESGDSASGIGSRDGQELCRALGRMSLRPRSSCL
jgi:hypothetical protein